jgi:hypothetical protein
VAHYRFNDCISFSPDGQFASYPSGDGLTRLNLRTGRATEIVQEPSADYVPDGHLSGKIDCAQWLGADRFLVTRFTGPMPQVVTLPHAPELAVNTTTLVVLSDGTQQDAATLWRVEATSTDGGYAVLSHSSDASGADATYAVAPTTDPLANPRSLNCARMSGCRAIGFLPGSDQVILRSQDVTLTYVNAATLAQTAGPIVPFLPSTHPLIRIGDPAQGRVAYVAQNRSLANYIGIADTSTSAELVTITAGQISNVDLNSLGSQVVGWLP